MEEIVKNTQNHQDENGILMDATVSEQGHFQQEGNSKLNIDPSDPADSGYTATSCTYNSKSHCDRKSGCCRKQKRQLNPCQDSPDQKHLKLGSKLICEHQKCEERVPILGLCSEGSNSNIINMIKTSNNATSETEDQLVTCANVNLFMEPVSCCSFRHDTLEPRISYSKTRAINDIPYSLLVHIFKQLSLNELLHRACLVCKYWLNVSQDSDLWRDINLRAMMKVDDQVLTRVTSYSDNVTSLDITDSRLIQTQGLSAVLANCATLQSLKLIRCQQLGQGAFEAIGRYSHQLRKLFIEGCYTVTNKEMEQISQGCPNVEVLNVNQCLNISDDGIKAIAGGCPQLRHLSMDHCTKVTDGCVPALVEGCPGLQELSCMSCDITDLGVRYLAQLKGLRILEVSNTRGVSGESIMYLVKCCRHLESLNLSLCTSINDQCIEFIARHAPVIRHLYLVSCSLTDIALQVLGSYCKTIQTVDVGWCQHITDVGVQYITGKCGSLRHLGLMRCDKVSIPTTEQLVEAYPHITFSTMWLDWKRLLDKAERSGLLPLPTVLDSVGPHVQKVP